MSQQPRILIIDGEPDNVFRLTGIFHSAGYTQTKGHSEAVVALDCARNFHPDLIVLDLTQNGRKGFEFLRALPGVTHNAFLPVLVITMQPDHAAREAAMLLGATDFITRPHNSFDLILRARNLLQTRALHQALQERNRLLECEMAERTQGLQIAQSELKAAQLDIIERLALAGEHHDDDTGAHTKRVAHTSRRLTQKLGLSDEYVELIFRAAPLHDVGKIGISDAILLKPGKLTPEEFDIIKTHCEIGARLLSNGRSDFLHTACTIALCHHERFDGTGYPRGLKGESIPIEGRILAVADVYDALTNERPYKKAWPVEEARAEIERQSGKQFDANVVRAFLTLDA
ncbi:cyclic di-GMP phosphodiesterase response regulator RpfG [Abditibacteriota bacterium]|nr:cyclic di-GMP phosphodiesterase response regulator RpfG [Abditibacteriota bacterium]